MATLGDSVQTVAYNLGNRVDLTAPIGFATNGVISLAAVLNGGQDYQLGDLIEVVLAPGVNGVVQVIEVDDENGVVQDVAILLGGNSYVSGTATTTGGSGTGLTLSIIASTVQGDSRIDQWLAKAYINLIMENRFPGTEGSITFATVQGQDIYPYPASVRAIQALTLYRPDGTIITVETKDITYIRRMNNTNQAAPSMWCEFSNQIIFRPVPDGNGPYTCVLDVWENPVIATPISLTKVLLPLDWVEALEYAATVRGHTNIQEDDKAHSVQALLYGFVDPQTGKYTPGLIQNLQTRLQASAQFKDWGLQPKGATQPFTRRR